MDILEMGQDILEQTQTTMCLRFKVNKEDHQFLKNQARKNKRSLNAELLYRLEKSIEDEKGVCHGHY